MAMMTTSQRATQIWAVLGLAARNRQILTYEIVGQLIGVPHYGLSDALDLIHEYCVQHDLPPLTILVVLKDEGVPSHGFKAASVEEYGKRQSDVFAEDWLSRRAPTPAELQDASRKKR